MTRAFALAVAGVVLLASAATVGAETYQFIAPDGTVHFTNAPTDRQYRRLRASPASGTARGFLRVPASVPGAALNELIDAAAARYAVPRELIAAVIKVESGFNARAVSRKGARGLMQLMPGTAAILGVRDSFDPAENIDGGVRHLRGLLDRFGNDLPRVLAAYNAGANAVHAYRGVPPYPETQLYVERIMAMLGGVGAFRLPTLTFSYVSEDGAVVYTNIPPRGVRPRR